VIQGRDPRDITNFLFGIGILRSESQPRSLRWIGTDESGKGDYFGPLVVASVLSTSSTKDKLLRLGVRDSKKIPLVDTIKQLAGHIKNLCPHSTVIITPPKYNDAYEKMRSWGKLHRILAWGHAKAIENILQKETCDYAVADQFSAEKYIKNALMERGRLLTLTQRHHAEDDVAVAAASILAKDAYTKSLATLSTKYSIDLPAGASNKVIETGKEFVQRYGKDELREVAKLHFVTTKYILDPDFFNKANT
jgi:ribonuclease HIII